MVAAKDGADGASQERLNFSYDWGGDIDLGVSIIRAVGILEGTPYEHIAEELSETVDGDALTSLFHPTRKQTGLREAYLVVAVSESIVTVMSDGTVIVERQDTTYR